MPYFIEQLFYKKKSYVVKALLLLGFQRFANFFFV